jgi:hypothetical protein
LKAKTTSVLLIAESSAPRTGPGAQWKLKQYFLNEGNEKISENMNKPVKEERV